MCFTAQIYSEVSFTAQHTPIQAPSPQGAGGLGDRRYSLVNEKEAYPSEWLFYHENGPNRA